MKCENIQFNLSVYLDDTLTTDERVAVDAHLAQCPLCRQKAADYQALRQQLRILERPQLPVDLLVSMRARRAGNQNRSPARTAQRFYRARSSLAADAIDAF